MVAASGAFRSGLGHLMKLQVVFSWGPQVVSHPGTDKTPTCLRWLLQILLVCILCLCPGFNMMCCLSSWGSQLTPSIINCHNLYHNCLYHKLPQFNWCNLKSLFWVLQKLPNCIWSRFEPKSGGQKERFCDACTICSSSFACSPTPKLTQNRPVSLSEKGVKSLAHSFLPRLALWCHPSSQIWPWFVFIYFI